MKANKWIGIIPMSSRARMTINDGDSCISFCDKHISKCHTHGPSTDNQIVTNRLFVHNYYPSISGPAASIEK